MSFGKRLMNVIGSAMCVLCLCMGTLGIAPHPAYAFETAKCTARPNADTGSNVLGGVETRITWEGRAAADEEVIAISLKLPDGTTYSLDNARFTILTGADLMTRENPPVTFSGNAEVVTVELDDAAAGGSYFRIEVYEVVFPASGGAMELTGTYTLKDGSTYDMGIIPEIAVTTVSPSEQLAQSLEQQDWVKQWNSNKFLRLFFNPPILVSSFPIVLRGFFLALGIVLVAFPLAIPIGLLLSFMRMSKMGVIRGLGSLYVNVVRGTPMFLQIYIAFFGLPLAGINIPSFPLGVIVLAMNSGAYLCEIFRAGIQSISAGQFEAARSLGMNGAQTMMYVIIPQTVRRVLPTMTNEFILLYKDTSLLAAVGVREIVMYAKTIVAATGSITPYIVAALFYLVITIPLARLVGKLEARLAGSDSGSSRSGRAGKKKAKAAVKAAAADAGAAGAAGAADAAGAGDDDSGYAADVTGDDAGAADMAGAGNVAADDAAGDIGAGFSLTTDAQRAANAGL